MSQHAYAVIRDGSNHIHGTSDQEGKVSLQKSLFAEGVQLFFKSKN
ncbi:hypothetical protein [Cupriavidus campinensis]